MEGPMTKEICATAAVVVLVLTASSSRGQRIKDQATSAASRIPKSRPLVVTVDHFFALSSDPERLFHTFRETFGLPVAWPFRSYGSFASGGLSVGNTVLEFATWQVPKGEVLKTEWKMLAFEPAGDTRMATAELTRRGIAYSKPDVNTYRNVAGKETVGWTNTGLLGPGLSDIAFLCDYEARQSVAGMHRKGSEELSRAQGGPLGLRGLKIIEVGVTDLKSARREWLKLIDVAGQVQGNVFHFGGGPSIQLVSASSPCIRQIVFQVYSLERAKTFLAQRQMLRATTGRSVSIAPETIGGLNVALVDE
jgi:hypothetical protein